MDVVADMKSRAEQYGQNLISGQRRDALFFGYGHIKVPWHEEDYILDTSGESTWSTL